MGVTVRDVTSLDCFVRVGSGLASTGWSISRSWVSVSLTCMSLLMECVLACCGNWGVVCGSSTLSAKHHPCGSPGFGLFFPIYFLNLRHWPVTDCLSVAVCLLAYVVTCLTPGYLVSEVKKLKPLSRKRDGRVCFHKPRTTVSCTLDCT